MEYLSEVKEMTANEEKGKTRKRSPNYPMLSLPKALERTRQLWGDKYNFVPLDVLPQRWGQKKKNSYTLQIVAALSAYGLIGTEGERNKKKIRLSTIARKILSEINVPDKDTLIKECALSPKLFKVVWDYYKKAGLPQKDVLKAELVYGDNEGFGFSFTEGAATLFISNFIETINFANLTTDDIVEETVVEENELNSANTGNMTNKNKTPEIIHSQDSVVKNFEMPLGDGLTAVLVVPYPLPKKKFELLNKIIKAYEDGIVGDTDAKEQKVKNDKEEEEKIEEITLK